MNNRMLKERRCGHIPAGKMFQLFLHSDCAHNLEKSLLTLTWLWPSTLNQMCWDGSVLRWILLSSVMGKTSSSTANVEGAWRMGVHQGLMQIFFGRRIGNPRRHGFLQRFLGDSYGSAWGIGVRAGVPREFLQECPRHGSACRTTCRCASVGASGGS